MQEVVTIIQQVGFPIAAALGLGWFIYKLIMRIVDGMETKLETLDDKVQTSLDTLEETSRLRSNIVFAKIRNNRLDPEEALDLVMSPGATRGDILWKRE